MAQRVFSAQDNQSQAGGQCQAGSHWQAFGGFAAQQQAEAQFSHQAQALRYQAWLVAIAESDGMRKAYFEAQTYANDLKELYIEASAKHHAFCLYDGFFFAQQKALTLFQFWNMAQQRAAALRMPWFEAQYQAQCEAQCRRTEAPPPSARISPANVTGQSVGEFSWL